MARPKPPSSAYTLTVASLLAALNVAEWIVIDARVSRDRHQEWIKCLKVFDGPTNLDAELQRANQPGPPVWALSPRTTILVERWFREMTQKQLERGTFTSVSELEQAIFEYVDHQNNSVERSR